MSVVDEILDAAATKASGPKEFSVITPRGELPARATLTAELLSADGIAGVRELTGVVSGWRGSKMHKSWKTYLPAKGADGEEPGLSATVASRIAWAKAAKAELGKIPAKGELPVYELLSDIDLLKLASKAGPLFMTLTDTIISLAYGGQSEAEVEALDDMGEDSTSTDSGAAS